MSAILSPCGTYRYQLSRDVGMDGPVFAFIGVNPSTADATADDATVRKWTGFVKRWGGSRFIVGNVFAYRSTDVKALRTVPYPVGPDNFAHMERIAGDADVLVPCWGDRAKVPRTLHHHIDKTLAFLRAQGKPVKAFGYSKGGDPLHPLMLGYDTPLVPYGVATCDGLSSQDARDAQRWRWIRRNVVRMEDYAFSVDEEVEAFVDAMIAQGLEEAKL